jgi:predicted hotdog family 3-hydroxylacyl-ACP dehydratase
MRDLPSQPTFPPVADLVPHSPPTLALDELVSWEKGRATLRLRIREHGLLVRDGGVDACVAMELMAQGAAACLGHEAFCGGGAVRVGMVVGCRRLTLLRERFLVGEDYVVEVRAKNTSDFVSSWDAEMRDAAGVVVAKTTMTIVHAEQPPS